MPQCSPKCSCHCHDAVGTARATALTQSPLRVQLSIRYHHCACYCHDAVGAASATAVIEFVMHVPLSYCSSQMCATSMMQPALLEPLPSCILHSFCLCHDKVGVMCATKVTQWTRPLKSIQINKAHVSTLTLHNHVLTMACTIEHVLMS